MFCIDGFAFNLLAGAQFLNDFEEHGLQLFFIGIKS